MICQMGFRRVSIDSKFKITLLIFSVLSFYFPSSTNADVETGAPVTVKKVADPGKFLNIYQLDPNGIGRFLAVSGADGSIGNNSINLKNTVHLFSCGNDLCNDVAQTPAYSAAFRASQTPLGIVVAYGYGRGELTAPLRVVLYKDDLSDPKIIFERTSERNEVTFLQHLDGKLWITFFESKFITKTGYFEPTASGPWTFHELYSTRLGDAVDIRGDKILVGRPYGDVQGQDGDVHLVEGSKVTMLPSYRGARSVKFIALPGEKSPAIVISDGWHQNYGQFAQARLSLITKNETSGRYALELIDIERESNEFSFQRFTELKQGKEPKILALGMEKLSIYEPSNNWKKTKLYRRTKTDSTIDLAVIKGDGPNPSFVVFNGNIDLVTLK